MSERHARPALQLVSNSTDYALHPKAVDVLQRLGTFHPAAPDDVPRLRRRYSELRLPLLAAKEPVASLVCIPPVPGGRSITCIRPYGAAEDAPLPALVYLHGGGWTYGGFDTYEALCRQIANATGRVVIYADYRLAPEHPFPAGLEDVWAACDWIAENAAQLRIDPRRIGIAGDSSGGNFAAVTCIAAREGLVSLKPDVQVLVYPCLDLTTSLSSHKTLGQGYQLTSDIYAWYLRNYVGSFPDLTDWHLSPLLADDLSGLPPAIILHAGFDPLRDEAIAYARRLEAEGTPVESIAFPRMMHGFLNMGGVFSDAQTGIHRIAQALAGFTV